MIALSIVLGRARSQPFWFKQSAFTSILLKDESFAATLVQAESMLCHFGLSGSMYCHFEDKHNKVNMLAVLEETCNNVDRLAV